jgi:hypothetical protein
MHGNLLRTVRQAEAVYSTPRTGRAAPALSKLASINAKNTWDKRCRDMPLTHENGKKLVLV